jgi:hypothetical protein
MNDIPEEALKGLEEKRPSRVITCVGSREALAQTEERWACLSRSCWQEVANRGRA